MNKTSTEKKLRFKLSPELADGCHYIIVDTPEDVAFSIKQWMEDEDNLDYDNSDVFTIEACWMSDVEMWKLGDI